MPGLIIIGECLSNVEKFDMKVFGEGLPEWYIIC